MKVDEWLSEGDAPEADWSSVVLQRAMSGMLGRGPDGVLLDLLALSQPHACRPERCTPGRRTTQARSCCADLDVGLADEEIEAIAGALDAVTPDARWPLADGWHDDEGFLRRAPLPGGSTERCVFARDSDTGLQCALHQLELARGDAPGTLKPLPCRLFPLALVAMDEDSWLLTAVHADTASHLATHAATHFPCLSAGAPALYVSERDVIEQVFGPTLWQAIDDAVRSLDEA